MKISGRIKALIIMAVVIYVLAHLVRAMMITLTRPPLRLAAPRRTLRLRQEKSLKHCSRC
ncbi:hypothetical protein [Salinicola avicenniae]|uniref:hypothetical protein n=1 Tax=Salinicola avicenniae TaxID=2916836 RepID=UPI002074211A|nr:MULTISPECIES: hypothetical protein [unclassified Salinicola]